VLSICAAVGYGSFLLGKNVIGEKLVSRGTPVRDLSPDSPRASDSAESDDTSGSAGSAGAAAPSEPVVEIEEVEPNSVSDLSGDREGEPGEASPEATPAEPDRPAPERTVSGGADEEDPALGTGTSEARPKKPPASTPADRPAAGTYVVRAGSFTTASALEARLRDLKALGYRPWQATYERDGVTYTRVHVAEFSTLDEAKRLQRELGGLGIEADISEE
jgi:cell division septation protein DedD